MFCCQLSVRREINGDCLQNIHGLVFLLTTQHRHHKKPPVTIVHVLNQYHLNTGVDQHCCEFGFLHRKLSKVDSSAKTVDRYMSSGNTVTCSCNVCYALVVDSFFVLLSANYFGALSSCVYVPTWLYNQIKAAFHRCPLCT